MAAVLASFVCITLRVTLSVVRVRNAGIMAVYMCALAFLHPSGDKRRFRWPLVNVKKKRRCLIYNLFSSVDYAAVSTVIRIQREFSLHHRLPPRVNALQNIPAGLGTWAIWSWMDDWRWRQENRQVAVGLHWRTEPEVCCLPQLCVCAGTSEGTSTILVITNHRY